MAHIYKIFRRSEYDAFLTEGVTEGAPVDIADGFVHFSTAEQVRETASKHFAGECDLVLLALEADDLGGDLKWEPSRGGALFPHLYRPLLREDVLWVRDLPFRYGRHDFADLLP